MRSIDINADIGESYGAWRMGDDAALLPSISSCSIACGFHGGDPRTMQSTVAVAKTAGVAIGAHPSLPDLQGFGRRELAISAADLYADTLYQIGALAAFVHAQDLRLHHVKAHGALYGMLQREPKLAAAFAAAVRDFAHADLVYGPPQGALQPACAEIGLRYLSEGFPDRAYTANGGLRSRQLPGAILSGEDARAQALALAQGHPIRADDGSALPLSVQTLCIHGDHAGAAELAASVRASIEQLGIAVRAP